MDVVGKIDKTGASLRIINVWFNRFDKDTGYRGGDATNMREKFAEYGLSERTMYTTGAAKVSLASLMLVGLFAPRLVRPASTGLAALMLGAIGCTSRSRIRSCVRCLRCRSSPVLPSRRSSTAAKAVGVSSPMR